jgi:AIR synthase-related protein
MSLATLAEALRASAGFAHKRDIGGVMSALSTHLPQASDILLGDDCAAIPDGGGHLLFAIEGLMAEFVQCMPWFAGYSAVMVNLSDIAAMGGRPIAVVDALWSHGIDAADQMLAGMAAASARYGVPIVGGHSNNRSAHSGLAVAVLGRAQALLTSFDARPGDHLVMAVDLRGAYHDPYAYWDASTTAPAARLRQDLALLPTIAEAGWCRAAKDISMAGAIGSALMLLECSRVGACIDVDAIPRPPGVSDHATLLRWLSAFPSYGFVLSVPPAHSAAVLDAFRRRGIAGAVVGEVDATCQLRLRRHGEQALLWDLAAQPFITGTEAPHAVA